MSEEDQEHISPTNVDFPPAFITIDGQLPDGKKLINPIVLRVQYEDEKVLVSETPGNLFGAGATIQEAIREFKRIMADELNELAHDDDLLSPRLQKQLQYLRSIIH